ncbi:AroM family protein [Salipiger abyssi]|uniref:Protein AroM n=1 Tax=Salipiger abyssi TaxID=1250539 RepID=A0A1P8UM81_9RHOB|nr:AroM family protein [Salipiger abyssi]APZ50483.1 protein AroM [Salipiger abyssi]
MNGKPVIGMLVIGQAPRPALLAEFASVLGDGAELKMLGALDHLDEAGLAAAAPTADRDTLFTTLPDGRSILISKAAVTEGMGQRLKDLEAMNAAVAIVCCTGKFPALEAPGVHFASDLVAGAVEGCLPANGRLGVFIPSAAQAAACIERWTTATRSCHCVPLSPGAPDDEIRAAAAEMAEVAPDLVLHDCISYTSAARKLAASIHGRPALLASTTCARLAGELAGI